MRGSGLILGWETGEPPVFGFSAGQSPPAGKNPIRFNGDGPLCCVAPTGSGKGRDFLIPILLTYPGPVVVLDPKGELSAVCGRARQAMGHRVGVLDPFGVTGRVSDRLNPFDLFLLPGSLLECDAEMLAAQFGEGHGVEKDPFWSDTATGINAGLIAYIASAKSAGERNLTALRSFLHDADLSYELAKLLDKGEGLTPFVREEFAAFLQHSAEKTRESVLSTATTFVKALGSEPVAKCLEDSTIALADIVAGKPLDVFITVPPEKLKSHRALIRLWVGTLITAVMRRKALPERKTLFVLDEAAQLSTFDPLLTAATLLRGYGLQLITVWQDLAQMKARYPQDWATILNNSAALLAFGFGHYGAAKEYAEVLGIEPRELAGLKNDEAVLAMRGEGTRKVGRLNYLKDELFAGMFDPDPYFERGPEIQPEEKAVDKPKTWVEKLERARQALRTSIAERKSRNPDDGDDRLFEAFIDMAEAIEEVGRLAQVPPIGKEKKPPRRKSEDREV